MVTPQPLSSPANSCLHIQHPKLEEWLDSPSFGNISIKLHDGKVYTHKEVLMKGSGYFRAMFNGAWGENNSNCITINNVSYLPFKAILLYLYSSQFIVPRSMALAVQVHSLSDFFEVFALRNLVADFIETAVSEKNALIVLGMAEKYSLENLKKKCKSLISNKPLEKQYAAM